MNRGTRAALVALACGALAGVPALARAQQDPLTGTVTAKDVGTLGDGRFSVNDGDATTLTVATGGTVTFEYRDGGASFHNVDFASAQPASCRQTQGAVLGAVPPLPAAPARAGWSGTCTFTAAGNYPFHCDLHADMTGTIVVRDQAGATPTPPPGATPTPTPTSVPGYPYPTPAPTPRAVQSTLRGAIKLASRQTGTRVRGSVQVKAARSRLEVAVSARLPGHKKAARVGHSRKTVSRAGRAAFAVRLSAKARRALRARHRLRLTVAVALTPPGGHRLSRTLHTTLRPG